MNAPQTSWAFFVEKIQEVIEMAPYGEVYRSVWDSSLFAMISISLNYSLSSNGLFELIC